MEDEVLPAELARASRPKCEWKKCQQLPCEWRSCLPHEPRDKQRLKAVLEKKGSYTMCELRQYRQQFLEAKMSEHKYWVDNDVYDLVDMSKHPTKNCVKKGRWVLTVKTG